MYIHAHLLLMMQACGQGRRRMMTGQIIYIYIYKQSLSLSLYIYIYNYNINTNSNTTTTTNNNSNNNNNNDRDGDSIVRYGQIAATTSFFVLNMASTDVRILCGTQLYCSCFTNTQWFNK